MLTALEEMQALSDMMRAKHSKLYDEIALALKASGFSPERWICAPTTDGGWFLGLWDRQMLPEAIVGVCWHGEHGTVNEHAAAIIEAVQNSSVMERHLHNHKVQ